MIFHQLLPWPRLNLIRRMDVMQPGQRFHVVDEHRQMV